MGSSVSISTAPLGSQETSSVIMVEPVVVGATILNALANSTESAAMTYANDAGKTYATVDIFLNPITPIGTPSIQIISGSTGYELAITTTASIARKVTFVDIPATFLASFTVKNLSGVAFASSGNYVVISPQY